MGHKNKANVQNPFGQDREGNSKKVARYFRHNYSIWREQMGIEILENFFMLKGLLEMCQSPVSIIHKK